MDENPKNKDVTTLRLKVCQVEEDTCCPHCGTLLTNGPCRIRTIVSHTQSGEVYADYLIGPDTFPICCGCAISVAASFPDETSASLFADCLISRFRQWQNIQHFVHLHNFIVLPKTILEKGQVIVPNNRIIH